MDMTKVAPMLRLRYERQRRKWRLDDLAHYSRMAASDISRIETGRLRPSERQLARLAKALKVDAGLLVEPAPATTSPCSAAGEREGEVAAERENTQ